MAKSYSFHIHFFDSNNVHFLPLTGSAANLRNQNPTSTCHLSYQLVWVDHTVTIAVEASTFSCHPEVYDHRDYPMESCHVLILTSLNCRDPLMCCLTCLFNCLGRWDSWKPHVREVRACCESICPVLMHEESYPWLVFRGGGGVFCIHFVWSVRDLCIHLSLSLYWTFLVVVRWT